jgi:hypothetical protein
MIKTLKYYSKDGTLTEFTKYTIDTNGVIRNKKGEPMTCIKHGTYNAITVRDDFENPRGLQVARAIASTFLGPPPTLAHTADHKNKNPDDDVLDNIRWLCKKGQRYNQNRPETHKFAFTIVKDGEEKTTKEWVEYLKDDKNLLGRDYTDRMIQHYAQKKQHGFSYKEYPDLPDEVWKEIVDSSNKLGRWEMSNMNRVKYITNHAENVLSGERLGMSDNGYPIISINDKQWYCHIISFMTFYPEEYANKKSNEMILHKDDDKQDFRPHKLRIGTGSENIKDAYNNGKHDGTKTARMRCASYVDGILEYEHASQADAVKYLKSNGFNKATESNIGKALNPKYTTTFAYGRAWKRVD